MSLSSVIQQTEGVLEEILDLIRKDYEGPYPVLSETDRNRFVEEEQSLREQLEEMRDTESNYSSWRRLILLRPSPPQATKGLKDAQEFRQRVKGDINAKVRTRLTGQSSLPPSSGYGHSPARTPNKDTRFPIVEGTPEPASGIITSPLNMRCSLSELELSDVHVNLAARNDHDYTADVNEAMNSPLAGEFRNGISNSSSPPRRRAPPPPPLPIAAQSINSRVSSETSSDSGSDASRRSHESHPVRRPAPPAPPQSPGRSRSPRSPTDLSFSSSRPLPDSAMMPSSETSSDSGSDTSRRSHPVRRPAPPPPQSPGRLRSPHSPTVLSLSSSRPLPDPAMMTSLSSLGQEISTLVSEIITGASSQSSQGRQRQRGRNHVVENSWIISDSNVEASTMNIGGRENAGAVIHKLPPPRSRPVPPS